MQQADQLRGVLDGHPRLAVVGRAPHTDGRLPTRTPSKLWS